MATAPVAKIKEIIEKSGGFNYANKKLDEFSSNAIESISSYNDGEIKNSLIEIVHFNKDRDR